MPKSLGLDVGMASVGFALVDYDDKSHGQIICANSHIFEKAENPKDGSSLAAPRRIARLIRRTLHRRAVRKRAVRDLLKAHGLEQPDYAAHIGTAEDSPRQNVWDLRAEGLVRRLTDEELSRVLCHIAKRRGFKSNSKAALSNDIEGKRALEGMKVLEETMLQTGARTIGEYLSTKQKKRNNPGEYNQTVTRDLLRKEIDKLFAEQSKFGNAKATTKLKDDFCAIAFQQRPIQSCDGLVGYCSLIPDEKRAPKHAPTSELFLLYSRLNILTVRTPKGDETPISPADREKIVNLVLSQKTEIKYSRLRKLLKLDDSQTFNLVGYIRLSGKDETKEDIRDRAEGAVFAGMRGYHALREALEPINEDGWLKLAAARQKLDAAAWILSVHKDNEKIQEQLRLTGFDQKQVEALSAITSFTKTINISIKAANKILPYMKEGARYDVACEKVGFVHSRVENKGFSLLPTPEKTGNPVVDRAISQTRKVVNAILRKHGMPDYIHIELARDLGKSWQKRREDEARNKKNEAYKKEVLVHAAELFGREPSGEEYAKFRLWKEQNGFCVYTGAEIKPSDIVDPTMTEIDHILPYSRSYDDSWNNKILCFTGANRQKGNKTPFEWLGGRQEWSVIEGFASHLSPTKARNLTLKDFSESTADKWKSRHLNDTRYLTRFLKNFIEENLDLGKGVRVRCINGAVTGHLRARWGLHKNRENGDQHHMQDAIVLACATPSMVQRLTSWNKHEHKNTTERPKPPLPWESFRDDVKKVVSDAFISRMPCRKATGEAHEATIKKLRTNEAGQRQIIQRIHLGKLTPALLEKMVDRARNVKLYNVLKQRLDKHDGKPDKAFAEPVYMPQNDGKQGPVIRGINVYSDDKSGIEVRGGIASNGGMVRVDVFSKNGKYYLCPIYIDQVHAHRKKGIPLPNKLIIGGKLEKDWNVLDDSFVFMFSLYKNDLVFIAKTDGSNLLGYYAGTDRSTAAIHILAHDGSKLYRSNGVQNLKSFNKYVVDYFGNKFKVKGEKRI